MSAFALPDFFLRGLFCLFCGFCHCSIRFAHHVVTSIAQQKIVSFLLFLLFFLLSLLLFFRLFCLPFLGLFSLG